MKIKLNNLFNANEIEIKDDVSNIDAVLDYEEVLLSISKSIIKYRKENNLTQKELAKKIGTNQQAISRLENLLINPSLDFLIKSFDKIGYELKVVKKSQITIKRKKYNYLKILKSVFLNLAFLY